MSKYKPAEGIKFEVGPDMVSPETRIARGAKISGQAVKSAIYAEPEVQLATDRVIADTAVIKVQLDDYSAAQAYLKKARTALSTGILAWDQSYRVLVGVAEKHCPAADDGTSLGLEVLAKTKYPFVKPLGVEVTLNYQKGMMHIRVFRAPGMKSVCVELGPDPISPASWVELAGHGAVHELEIPAPGTWWVRAASRSAKAKTDFTEPVAVKVK